MSNQESTTEGPRISQEMTVAELLGLCGSANHSTNDKTMEDLWDALGEAHPAVAGALVDHLRRALDRSTGKHRGTASGTEHPEWHTALERAKQNSDPEGYDD